MWYYELNHRSSVFVIAIFDINGTVVNQFKFCFCGRKFLVIFYLELEEIEGDDKTFRRWVLNVVIVLQNLLFWLYSEVLYRKDQCGDSCPGKKYLPHFLESCTFFVMQTDACEIGLVLDVSVLMLWSSL